MNRLWWGQIQNFDGYVELVGSYNLSLVVLSVLVASLGAFSGLIIKDRIIANGSRQTSSIWINFGALVLGLAVWSMHFTGMLAFVLPVEMAFDPFITFASIIPVLVGANFYLRIAVLNKSGFWWIQLQSLVFALGVGSMHYIGMEAMKMNVIMVYSLPLFIKSILVAHILAAIATYTHRVFNTDETSSFIKRAIVAVIMGAAISGMHYTGMKASSYFVAEGDLAALHNMGHQHWEMAFFIVIVVVIFVGISVIGTVMDRNLQIAIESADISKLREKTVVDSLSDALLVVDDRGLVESANSSAIVQFGFDDIRIEGQPLRALLPQFTYATLLEDVRASSPQLIGTPIETQGIRKDGVEFPVDVIFSTMASGTTVFFNAVIRDISERKQIEQRLMQSQKLEAIGQLSAGVAHEINSPVQFISDNTYFLKDAFEEMSDAIRAISRLANTGESQAAQESIEQILSVISELDFDYLDEEIPKALSQSLEGVERVSTIVGAMKVFSHPGEVEKQLKDVNAIVESSVTLSRSEWKYCSEMELDLTEDLPTVECNHLEISQVIINIIVNAAHAIESSLEGTKDKGSIRISSSLQGSHVVVAITDNGGGMPEHVKRRVFDPFFTTKEVGKGTGQGLAISYSVIVEKHGGELVINSTLGQGSIFEIKLPVGSV
ncbi:MHYT domain-containing protein [Halioxenophilus aromaticivorans]|uniref:histidine kinase n=1 Tax=Halioxenophilus aromaticivorans TaxID=1306992 RepID=A0AAV3U0Z9_9ALTE